MSVRSVRIGSTLVNIADSKPTFWDRVEAGTWEPETLAVLARLIRPGTVLVDIGAWVGPITLLAASLGATVVAIEPDPTAVTELRANLAANPRLDGRVRVVEGALASEPGTVRLGARRKPGDSMSSVLLAEAAVTWDAVALTPDDLDRIVPPSDDLVVKIDIEGGEYRLLPALAPFFARRRPVVLLSLHPDILRASGVSDVETATSDALAPFRGWDVVPLDGARSSPGHAEDGEWLILPPGHGGSAA